MLQAVFIAGAIVGGIIGFAAGFGVMFVCAISREDDEDGDN